MATIAISLAAGFAAQTVAQWLQPTKVIDNGGLSDLSIPKSNYGVVIPRAWGTVTIGGNLFWGTAKEEKVKKKKRGKGGGGTVEKNRTYYGNFAHLFAYTPSQPAIKFVRLWMNGKVVYSILGDAETINNGSAFASQYLRFYLGSKTQNPDPLIESLEPISTYNYGLPHEPNARAQALVDLGLDPNTIYPPAYRQRVYCVAERLPLADWGNQLPTIKAEIEFSNPCYLADIIVDICSEAGLSSSQIDVTGVSSIPVTGFYLDRITKANEALQLLQQCYFFDIVQSEGKIKFISQANPRSALNLDNSNLATHIYNQARPETYTIEPEFVEALPKEVNVNFIDPDLEYEENAVKARSQVIESEESKTFNLPIVLTAAEAIALSEKLLQQYHLNSTKFKLTLPPLYGFLEVADRLVLDGNTIQITRINLGANRLLQVEAKLFNTVSVESVSLTRTVETGGYNEPIDSISITTPGDTTLHVFDIPLISDVDNDRGVYLTGGGGSSWEGAEIYASIDGSVYEFVAEFETYGTYGTATVNVNNTITVVLDKGELDNATTADLAAGKNLIIVGQELLQFTTRTLTATNTYELSGLQRGKRGTEWAIDAHVPNETFALMTGEDAYIERISNSAIAPGQTLYFKAVSYGQSLDSVSVVTISYVGNDLKPYAPINLNSTRDEAGNITITWVRRDRHAGAETDPTKIPLSETREEFELEVLDNGTSTLRTITTNETSYIYLSTDQMTDFGSPQTSIAVSVYQISSVVGRGFPASVILTPALVAAEPKITGFSPVSGIAGQLVTISGSGFTNIDAVYLDSLSASFTVVNDTSIELTIPDNPVSGFIGLDKGAVNALSPYTFTVEPDGYLTEEEFLNSNTGLILASKVEAGIGGIPLTFFRQVTSSRSLEDNDLGAIIDCDTTSGSITITLDETLLTSPTGFNCYLRNVGTGIVYFSATTLEAIDNKITEQWGVVRVSFEANNVWLAYGDLAEAAIDIKNKLESLSSGNRLDVTAIKNLRQGHNVRNDQAQNFSLRNYLKFSWRFYIQDDNIADETIVNVNVSDSIVEGLLAYFPFENSYQDYLGRLDLTGVNDGTITYNAGVSGNQVVFDGNETLEIESSLLQLGHGSFTISFWLSIPQLGQFYKPLAINASDGSPLLEFSIPTDNKPVVTFNNANSITSSHSINILGLHHFVITYYFWSNQATLWVDSQRRSSNSFVVNPFTNPSKLILGKNAVVTVPQGLGLDSLAIWNRFLSEPEIDYLYAGTEISTAINANPEVDNILTPSDIRDALASLNGADRLDASAIQNIPDPTIRVNSDYFRRVENQTLTPGIDLQLTNESYEYQYIDPNGVDGVVKLPQTPSTGKFFQITNINGVTKIDVQDFSGTLLFSLYNDGNYERIVADCTYDGASWKIIVW